MAVLDADARKACATRRPVAVLNLFEQSDDAPKGAVHTQQSVNVSRKWARCSSCRVGLETATRYRARGSPTPMQPNSGGRPASLRCPGKLAGVQGRARAGNGSCPGVAMAGPAHQGDFPGRFLGQSRPVARRLSVPGAMMSYHSAQVVQKRFQETRPDGPALAVTPQKAVVSMRPCRSRMTASAFCTASTSSGLHSTSMNTCFLSRPPLEVRQPQTMTRPFERGTASPEKIKRACVMAELRPLASGSEIFSGAIIL
jgi:hypothetical protein